MLIYLIKLIKDNSDVDFNNAYVDIGILDPKKMNILNMTEKNSTCNVCTRYNIVLRGGIVTLWWLVFDNAYMDFENADVDFRFFDPSKRKN